LIRAVFFDWFNTLALYHPPREELQSQALQEFGIDIPPDKVRPALLIADRVFFEENAISPISKRSSEKQADAYIRYEKTLLNEAGDITSYSPDTLLRIMKKVQELYKDIRFILYDDVLPTMKMLKRQNLTIGLLTNIQYDMKPVCHELGLDPFINFIVTSGEVGADKPQPQIFLVALERARIKASEVIHVGDQYKIDAVGAMGVGIKPILIDRYDLYPEVKDCPRIHSLSELTIYI
jgi:putative hydrolase of the HAD superfamily